MMNSVLSFSHTHTSSSSPEGNSLKEAYHDFIEVRLKYFSSADQFIRFTEIKLMQSRLPCHEGHSFCRDCFSEFGAVSLFVYINKERLTIKTSISTTQFNYSLHNDRKVEPHTSLL